MWILETQFVSNRFRNLCQLDGISLKISAVESHNSNDVGERYHSSLRRIYQKVVRKHPNINNDAALEVAVRVLNDTAGPNGLVLTLLVFGVMPRMPIRPMELPSQLERMTAIHAARKELSQLIASHRVTQALQRNTPSASISSLKIGDEDLVYRETPRQWVGPYRVLDVLEKIVHLDVDGRHVRFSIDKVKPYFRERGSSTAEDVVPTPAIERAAETTDRGDIIQDLRRILDGNNGGEVEPSPFVTSSTDIL